MSSSDILGYAAQKTNNTKEREWKIRSKEGKMLIFHYIEVMASETRGVAHDPERLESITLTMQFKMMLASIYYLQEALSHKYNFMNAH